MAQILVVDDDPVTCRTVARLLQTEGHQARSVSCARDAMKSVSDHLPHLVVLDVMLPDVTGLELLRTFRSDPRTRDLPIVLYTAVGDESVRAEALSLGTPDVVLKGGGWAELLRHLSKHLTPQGSKPV